MKYQDDHLSDAQLVGIADWEVVVAEGSLSAHAQDTAGNEERWPHRLSVIGNQ